MIEPYEVFLRTEAISTLRALPLRQRKLVGSFIDQLADDPFAEGDFQNKDAIGRILCIKVVGSAAITYWADHAVKEIKVLDIREADRA